MKRDNIHTPKLMRRHPSLPLRPNKLAAGMTATSRRSNHGERMSYEALTLSVRGTLDPLARKHLLLDYVETHAVVTYGISPKGRKQLAKLRAAHKEAK